MPPKRLPWFAIACIAFAALWPVSARAASSAARGTATATSTLLRVTTPSGSISVGADDADARSGTVRQAFARFVSGRAGERQVGATERSADDDERQASDTIGHEEVSIDDALWVQMAGGSVFTSVSRARVRSTVDAHVASAEVAGGLLATEGGILATEAVTDASGARVTRSIEVEQLTALSPADLLSALGVDPETLSCEALDELAPMLGESEEEGCAVGSLDTPLVTFDAVTVDIRLDARESDPSVSVDGAVGSLTIAGRDPLVVPLPLGDDEVETLRAMLVSAIEDVARAAGIDDLTPAVDLFAIDTATGRHDDGAWFAEGAVSLMRVTFDGIGALAEGDASTTALAIDVGTFEAAGSFMPASEPDIDDDDGGEDPPDDDDGTKKRRRSGGSLPVTGVGDAVPTLSGVALIALAGLLRRRLLL